MRNFIRTRNILPLFIAQFLFAACFADSETTLKKTQPTVQGMTAEQLVVKSQCGTRNSQNPAIQFTSVEALSAFYKKVNSHIVSSKSVKVVDAEFSRNIIIGIFMGQKFTGGYSVRLADEKIRVKQGVATVKVSWKKPAGGSFSIQVLTSPCAVIRLSRGEYQKVQVIDQKGKLRASIDVR